MLDGHQTKEQLDGHRRTERMAGRRTWEQPVQLKTTADRKTVELVGLGGPVPDDVRDVEQVVLRDDVRAAGQVASDKVKQHCQNLSLHRECESGHHVRVRVRDRGVRDRGVHDVHVHQAIFFRG